MTATQTEHHDDRVVAPVDDNKPSAASFFSVYADARTYSSIVFLISLLGIGIATFTYAVTMFTLGVGLAIIMIGFPLLYIFMWSLPKIMVLLGIWAEATTGVPTPIPTKKPVATKSYSDKFIAQLKDPLVQKAFILSVLLLPIGIFSFTAAVTLIAVSIGFSLAILSPAAEWTHSLFVVDSGHNWMNGIPTGPRFVLYGAMSVVGILLLTLSMHALRGLAKGIAMLIQQANK